MLSYIAPNVHELRSLQAGLSDLSLNESSAYSDSMLSWHTNEKFRLSVETKLPAWILSEGVLQSALRLLPFVDCLFVKAGSKGLVVVQRTSREQLPAFETEAKKGARVVTTVGPQGGLVISSYEALRLDSTASAVGGGDSLLGGLLAGISKGLRPSYPADLDRLVYIGQRYD